jgi:protein SDA1
MEKERESYEPYLTEIVDVVVTHLKEEGQVNFDYNTGEILFDNDPIDPEEVRIDQEDRKVEEKIRDYIDKYLSNGDWFDSVVLPGIYDIEVTNERGFNEDHRSHRVNGVDKDTHSAKRIKVCSPAPDTDDDDDVSDDDVSDDDVSDDDVSDDDVSDDDDEEFSQRVYGMDGSSQESPWEKHNEHGITWGDVMEGIMMAKGSKGDWWYELIVRLEAKIDGQKLFITFDCDHGS